MNTNSISSVDTKAALAPSKGENTADLKTEESTEKKGFLEALAEVFGGGKTQSKEEVSELEVLGEVTETESTDALLAKGTESSDAEEGEEAVTTTMSAGSELLERLGESNQTLQETGKPLPAANEEVLSVEEAEQLTPEQMLLMAQANTPAAKEAVAADTQIKSEAVVKSASPAVAWGNAATNESTNAQLKGQQPQVAMPGAAALAADSEALKSSLEAPSKDQLQAAMAAAMGRDVRKNSQTQLAGTTATEDFSTQLSAASGQVGLQTNQLKPEVAQQVQAPLHLQKEMAGEQLAERVQMMLSKNLKNVDIRLDPPELGRMQIRMTMNGDVANVQITVSNGQARDVIEQSMPRLREMLAQSGVQLAESSVQQQNSGQQQQYATSEQGDNGSSMFADGEISEDDTAIAVNVSKPSDGISYFA